MNGETILETRNLKREIKGFVAVNDVDLKVKRGSIHALIGPNGAGKTTVFTLVTKFLAPTRGRILLMQNYGADIGEWVTVITGGIFVVCVLAFRRGIVGELAGMFKK